MSAVPQTLAANDPDVLETAEWIEALDAVLEREGPHRAHYLLERLIDGRPITEAIVLEVRRQTPYALVDRSAAQTVLTGTIRKVDLGTLATDRQTGLAAETAISITIDFAWTDARTGRSLTSRRNFSAARSFIPAQQAGERIETGQVVTVSQLARDVVAEMRSGW